MEDSFQKLFVEAQQVADMLGISLRRPRIASHSVYRPSVEGDGNTSIKSFYRINM